MNEKLIISIPEPCHENWNLMSPVEQGRFCSNCKKNVIDFTTKNDDEILNFFNTYNGNTCGRFSNDQLDRPLDVIQLKQSSSFLKYAATLLLPLIMVSNKLNAQKKNIKELKEIVINGYAKKVGKVAICTPVAGPVKIIEKDTFQFKPIKHASIEQLLSGKITCFTILKNTSINGIVFDEQSGAPIGGTTILLKGDNTESRSDANGKFSLKTIDNNGILVFSSIGYVSKEINVSQLSSSNKNIFLSPAIMGDLYGVIIVGIPVKRKKDTTGGTVVVSTKKMSILSKLKDTLFPPVIKIYPNPVSSSGTINLSFRDIKSGQYQIRLINAVGQIFYSFQKKISDKKDTEQIHLSEKMISGIYFIQVIDEQKKLIQSSKIIVE